MFETVWEKDGKQVWPVREVHINIGGLREIVLVAESPEILVEFINDVLPGIKYELEELAVVSSTC